MRHTENKEIYHRMFEERKCCIIIPTYNNGNTLKNVVERVLQYTDQVIVINDGSSDDTINILNKFSGLDIIENPRNMGKGFAMRKGFKHAIEKGYKYAITIDSDGQHSPDDIPTFLDKLQEEPEAIIIGARNMTQDGVPRKSSFGHKFSNFWFKIETNISLPDTQCGFRLYPLDLINKIKFITRKFEFEIEIIVRSAWRGIKIVPVPVSVYYAPRKERVSHFRTLPDFTRISILNTCLVTVALLYIKPFQFIQDIKRNGIRDFIKTHLLSRKESNMKKTLAVMLGVFIGISPFWGWQTLIVLSLAIAFKLNKFIAIVASNISIPPMIPIILFGSFKLGGVILNRPSSLKYNSGINFEIITKDIIQYVTGSLCLGALAAISIGLITFIFLITFRKKPVVDKGALKVVQH